MEESSNMKGAANIGRFRAALYLLLQNDLAWNLALNDDLRRRVLAENLSYNDERGDYTPEKYQKGKSFESPQPRRDDMDGRWLLRFLERHHPVSVLECGPGSGFLSRAIVEHPSVARFIGVDVNKSFIDYLECQISAFKQTKKIDSQFFLGDIKTISVDRPVDAVLFSSSLHHIPDRLAVFEHLAKIVRPGGWVVCIEPAHYLPRLRHLWKKLCKPGYLDNMTSSISSLSTHHFCTYGEFAKLAKRSGSFRIVEHGYGGHGKALVAKLLNKLFRMLGASDSPWLKNGWLPARLWAERMFIVLERI
jgi:SAM-dependent methyltransferase